jgi:hypothetical protein
MQEFSSVTASSYDAESLAPLLNEKAADGWSVVSIVSAGTNIVAYLQREADEAAAAPADEASVDESPVDEAPATEAPAAEATDSPFVPAAAAAAATAVDDAPAPVDEPAGWASAPDEQATAPAEASIADLAAQVSEPEPEPAVAEPAVAEPAVAEAPAADSAVPAGWYADPSGRFELRYWDGAAWTEHVSRAGQQFTDPPVA